MKFLKTITFLSNPRIDRYLRATGNNKKRAIRLYKANLRIAQSFFPLLSVLEVALRNRIDNTLAVYFNDTNWIRTQKTGFMRDPGLIIIDNRTGNPKLDRRTGLPQINDYILEKVRKAEADLRFRGAPVTSGKIIAEQTFGFWTTFFKLDYSTVLRGRPIQAFTNLPAGYGRSQIEKSLYIIRNFRNRISHNEPICFDTADKIDFSMPASAYAEIINILNWLDPDLLSWAKDIDSVHNKITSAKRI